MDKDGDCPCYWIRTHLRDPESPLLRFSVRPSRAVSNFNSTSRSERRRATATFALTLAYFANIMISSPVLFSANAMPSFSLTTEKFRVDASVFLSHSSATAILAGSVF